MTSISAGDGNDEISGGSGADELISGPGDDTLSGGDGADSMTGGAGADTIRGDAGADEIVPGPGADTVFAGPGADRVSIETDAAPDTVRPGDGDDELDLSADDSGSGAVVDPTRPGGDGVEGNDDYGSFETVLGTAGPDRFVAPPAGMTAVGGPGGDRFVSGPGDDTFYGGDADDPADPMGQDTVTYADADAGVTLTPTDDAGIEQATGDGDDRLASVTNLIGSPHADRVETATIERVRPGLGDDEVGFDHRSGYLVAEPGRDGNDASLSCATWDYSARTAPLSLTANGIANDGMSGEADNVGAECDGVSVLGGSGDDRIVGDAGRNVLAGGRGDDRVVGKPGGDYLWGGPGADEMLGGSGADDVAGGKGNDWIRELGARPNGTDVLHGNGGRDTLTYAGRNAGVIVTNGNLRCDDGADGEGDCVTRHDPFEVIIGTSSADRLVGSGAADRLYGRNGPDVLIGGRGSDHLFGAAGHDRLTGSRGKDALHGGGGGDRFFARDQMKDTLKGGYGRDLARRDRVDVAYSIEGKF